MPVAIALASAGHDVAVCSSPTLRPEVEAFGLCHLDAGVKWHMSWRAEDRPWADLVHGGGSLGDGMARLWVSVVARAFLPDLLAVARHWAPDVIIRESTEYAGCVAAERIGVPHVSVLTDLFTAAQLASPPLRRAVNELRAEVGLCADDGAMEYRYLHLCPVPPRFLDESERHRPSSRFVQHMPRARPSDELPESVLRLPDRPTVFASLGTTTFATDDRRLWKALMDGLAGEDLNVVLAVGIGGDPYSFGPPPPNVVIERFVPQVLLLPNCGVMVTSGGFTSVRDALSFGIPLVVVPVMGPQWTVAGRCQALGLGRCLAPGNATPTAVHETVRTVLDDPSYAREARSFAQEMSRLLSPDEMVVILENVVAGRI
ncbi:MAG TPA: glycosyltransferase [Acidimicrobiales bacterium]|nr:glycosyltransferase [Acidimicrobiales bacterium]